jgi:hypothetical protein
MLGINLSRIEDLLALSGGNLFGNLTGDAGGSPGF